MSTIKSSTDSPAPYRAMTASITHYKKKPHENRLAAALGSKCKKNAIRVKIKVLFLRIEAVPTY